MARALSLVYVFVLVLVASRSSGARSTSGKSNRRPVGETCEKCLYVVTPNAFARVVNGTEETIELIGFNHYFASEIASETREGLFGMDWTGGLGTKTTRKTAETAAANGMNAMRAWTFSVREDADERRDDEVIRGLRTLASEAARVDVYLILALSDYWNRAPSALKTCVGDENADDDRAFYEKAACRDAYKRHARRVVETLREYPNVAAWNLINEPRCRGCDDALQAWIDEMAAYVKSIDPRRLVTVGEEGFYARDGPSPNAGANPAPWAYTTGQDFVRNHASPNVDFAAAHIWRDNWAVYSPIVAFDGARFTRNWIRAHEEDARRILRKPVVIEEFGAAERGVFSLQRSSRDDDGRASNPRRSPWFLRRRNERARVSGYYRTVFSHARRSIASDAHVRGALFWNFFPDVMRGRVEEYDPYAVFASDDAFAEAARFAASVRAS